MKLSRPSWLPVLALLVAVVSMTTLPSPVTAWGEFGHEIVANLAWRRLSSSTQCKISALLNITNTTLIEESGSPLAAVANWADHVRHFLPWSAELHYIDVRDNLITGGCHYQEHDKQGSVDSTTTTIIEHCNCDFQYDRDCPEDICVAGAIMNYSTQLLLRSDPHRRRTTSSMSSSLRTRAVSGREDTHVYRMQQALKFLTHFIGDIHQPLHASRTTDKGGNDITVQYHLLDKSHPVEVRHKSRSASNPVGYSLQYHHHHPHHHSWNLHSIWDTALIETALQRDYDHQRSKMEDYLEKLLQQHPEWTQHYESCGVVNIAPSLSSSFFAVNSTCVIDWGQESWSYALEYAYTKNEPWEDSHTRPVEVSDGDDIGEEYYETRIAIVNERLIAGGVRLAMALEGTFVGMADETRAAKDIQDNIGGSVLSLWSKWMVERRL